MYYLSKKGEIKLKSLNHNFLNKLPKLNQGERFILGIDGLSRAGKTTYVDYLQKNYQESVIVFHIDDYILEREKRYQTGFEEWCEYYYLQWDVKGLSENLFKKLKTENELHLSFYLSDFDRHINQYVQLPKTCLVIVEGIFLQRPEWRDYFDFMLYIDCPRDKRFAREREATRVNIEKFENRYWKAEDYYLETVNPIRLADEVLENY